MVVSNLFLDYTETLLAAEQYGLRIEGSGWSKLALLPTRCYNIMIGYLSPQNGTNRNLNNPTPDGVVESVRQDCFAFDLAVPKICILY